MRSIVFNCLIGILIVVSFKVDAENSNWVKIIHPTTEQQAELHDKGIHYPNFIWIEMDDEVSMLMSQKDQTINNPYHFRIDDQWLDLKTDDLPNNQWFRMPDALSKGFFLIQFNGPIKPSWLDSVSDLDIKLINPMAPFSWIVWADINQLNQLSGVPGIRYTGYLHSVFRVQSSNRQLTGVNLPSMALVYQGEYQQALSQLRALGAQITHQSPINNILSAINFTLDGDQYLQAVSIPGIMTVQQVHNDGGARGEMSQQSVVGNYDNNNDIFVGYDSWLNNTGLDGSGVVVSVVDGGIYQNHPDLTNVVACSGVGASCADSTNDHGTHVAGAIGGTGVNNSLDTEGFNRGLGVAPGVQIIEQLYSPLLGAGPGGMVAGGMLSIYKDSATSSAVLSNNSWGPTGIPQGYDIPTMEVDMISRDANPDVAGNQPILAVWSIMNGNGDRNVGTCAPSSLGSPDEAKNLFAVGSTKLQNANETQISQIFDVSANSAHGPACDGRLVPHIVAPGCRTAAPNSATGYGMKCGTSMASPVVSGSISLFWQQYKNTYLTDPSPALIKAVFTVVADDLDGHLDADNNVMSHAPDRKQGWGRLNLEQVVNPDLSFWFYDQGTIFTQSGEMWQQQFTPSNPAQPMRIMLSWTDAPGAGLGGTNSAWVNDLDLSVTTDVDYLGNQFGGDGFSATGGIADSKNNLEGVFLTATQHQGQIITIEVLASNIAADALNPYTQPGSPQQDFAIACYNCELISVSDVIFENGFDEFTDIIFKDGFE